MISYKGKLALANYTLPALMSYDPRASNSSTTCNTTTTQCTNIISNWSSNGGLAGDLRPEALISAPDGNLYAGAVGHYGQLNGPIVKWNVQTGTAAAYYPYAKLGVASLSVATACKGVIGSTFCLIGGTTTAGGSGSTTTATTSPLFIWNPVTNAVVKSFTIPNVPNVVKITDLITNPVNNYVYGIASSTSASYLFIFNPRTGTFINGGTSIPFYPLYNSVSIGSDGNIWGAAVTGIFTINLTTNTTQLVFRTPQQITAGFALVKDAQHGDKIYVASNADLYMYAV